ncbi:MAG: segregation/condensation protein A [Clostridia bacterium]|nr:segregation/condensation protein A [Clostridia bacterium]
MFKVQMGDFEGSLSDLVEPVEKQEIDPLEISISGVTEQYLEYISRDRGLDFETAVEFLAASVTLMDLKTKALLPETVDHESTSDEEPETSEELAEHLLEYKTFKEAALFLDEKFKIPGKIYGRYGDMGSYIEGYFKGVDESPALEGIGLKDLLSALENIAKGRARGESDALEVSRRRHSVADKIQELLPTLSRNKEGRDFKDIFTKDVTRAEVIVTFLALLELVRLQKIRISQEKNFGTIKIYPVIPATEVKE